MVLATRYLQHRTALKGGAMEVAVHFKVHLAAGPKGSKLSQLDKLTHQHGSNLLQASMQLGST